MLKSDFVLASGASLGVMLHELGQLEESTSSLITAIDLNPDYIEAWNNIWLSNSNH